MPQENTPFWRRVLLHSRLRARIAPVPLKQRYPWNELRERRKRMSIAIGVVCTDGLVLGTDLEYTGSYEKFPGKKLWQLCPDRGKSILLTGAGNPVSIDHVRRIAEDEIRRTKRDSWMDIVSAVETGLRSLYSLHIDPAPKESQVELEIWVMLAVRDGVQFRLFHNDRSVLGEVEKLNCSGMGLYVGYTMLDLLLPNYCSTDLASEVVSYILALSKEWTANVGKGSNVHMLYHTGQWDSLLVPERRKIEAAYIDLLKDIPELVGSCEASLPPDIFDSNVKERLAKIREKLEHIRALQKERSDRRLERASRARYPQGPQSTKADP